MREYIFIPPALHVNKIHKGLNNILAYSDFYNIAIVTSLNGNNNITTNDSKISEILSAGTSNLTTFLKNLYSVIENKLYNDFAYNITVICLFEAGSLKKLQTVKRVQRNLQTVVSASSLVNIADAPNISINSGSIYILVHFAESRFTIDILDRRSNASNLTIYDEYNCYYTQEQFANLLNDFKLTVESTPVIPTFGRLQRFTHLTQNNNVEVEYNFSRESIFEKVVAHADIVKKPLLDKSRSSLADYLLAASQNENIQQVYNNAKAHNNDQLNTLEQKVLNLADEIKKLRNINNTDDSDES